jgi:hypothetical protein
LLKLPHHLRSSSAENTREISLLFGTMTAVCFAHAPWMKQSPTPTTLSPAVSSATRTPSQSSWSRGSGFSGIQRFTSANMARGSSRSIENRARGRPRARPASP